MRPFFLRGFTPPVKDDACWCAGKCEAPQACEQPELEDLKRMQMLVGVLLVLLILIFLDVLFL